MAKNDDDRIPQNNTCAIHTSQFSQYFNNTTLKIGQSPYDSTYFPVSTVLVVRISQCSFILAAESSATLKAATMAITGELLKAHLRGIPGQGVLGTLKWYRLYWDRLALCINVRVYIVLCHRLTSDVTWHWPVNHVVNIIRIKPKGICICYFSIPKL